MSGAAPAEDSSKTTPPKPAAAPAKPKPAKPHAAAEKTKPAAPAQAAAPAAGDKTAPAAAAEQELPPLPPGKVERAEAVKRANAFFNASPVMTADFVQMGADGRRSEGKLYVQRAGRVRFEYAEPATLEVVSDGVQVMVRDRKMKTQDLYFINQTPLKFLMKEKIDLETDVKVLDVSSDDSGVIVSVEDKATFGGTSYLKLIFDPKTFKLKQWQITDPQGNQTLLSLFNIDQKRTPDPALFKIEQAAKAEKADKPEEKTEKTE
ncbi:cell envelope biogenesis protein LolA [Methylocystis heyeri]|uniref:Cell envelope biogenesis protein LolA n=2 Tax=Methylocystis heyeri TaxID=391905 RepID=A0A6B8KMC0_9HYPH|nr:cell envelope biogenesis protein LolA [Methylocystis heyeri]